MSHYDVMQGICYLVLGVVGFVIIKLEDWRG